MHASDPLVANYVRYCLYRQRSESTSLLDLSDLDFIFPGALLPLINFQKKSADLTYRPPSNAKVARYLGVMGIGQSQGSAGDTHFPLVPLSKKERELTSSLEKVFRILEDGSRCGGKNAMANFVSEFVNNIDEHSGFNNANILGQRYDTLGFTEICFFDDGISIPGSFRAKGIPFSVDQEAIQLAISGVSTNDAEGRGFGLGTSFSLLVNGLRAEVLLVSGKAAFYARGAEKQQIYDLSDPLVTHQGTIITVRIPFTTEEIDIYPYVERRIKLKV